MIWTILGIEETKDKKAITRAFRERLSSVNPEEKPEEFKELRAAYEAALAFADQQAVPEAEKTEAERWTDQLGALYADLQRRQDVAAWEELLAQDFCQALDTRAEAEDALLVFMQEHFRIPHDVLQCLNRRFGFTEHMAELREKHPGDFLDYVILDGLRAEADWFPLSMFAPGRDGEAADDYIRLYNKLSRSDDPEERKTLSGQMLDCRETHPYGEALLLKIRVIEGDLSAIDGLQTVHERYPADVHLALDLMFAYKQAGQPDRMEALADTYLDGENAAFAVRRYKAEALAARKEFKEAEKIINRLLREYSGDHQVMEELYAQLRAWNTVWIPELKEKLAVDPGDAETRYDLIWCLIQSDSYEEADGLAALLSEGQPEAFGYYNTKASIAGALERQEEALMYLQKLLDVVEHMEPDGTELTESRIGRRAEVSGRIAAALFGLGRKEEAVEMAERAVREDDNDLGLTLNLISMYLQTKAFERASELADGVIRKEPGNAYGYYYKAYADFRKGRDSDAFEAVNNALDRDATNLGFYLLKLRILIRNYAFEDARKLIDYLKENGIEQDPTIEFCEVLMFRKEEDARAKQGEATSDQAAYDRILGKAAELDEKLNSDEYGQMDWAGEFYYTYAALTADRQEFEQKYPVEPLIGILDKGLALAPEDYDCLSYKGWLLKKIQRTDEALAIFKKLEEKTAHNAYIEDELAELYYRKLEDHAAEALHYYKLAIEREPEDANLYFFAGMCLFRLERPAEAEGYFRKEQELAPEDIDGYWRLAYVLLKLNRPEDAVEQGRKAVELAKKRKEEDRARFWRPLITAYRRMGKADEAIRAAADCAAHNPKWDSEKLMLDIYLQFGMTEKVQELISAWDRVPSRRNGDCTTARLRLYMAENRMFRLNTLIRLGFNPGTEEAVWKQAKRVSGAENGARRGKLDVYQSTAALTFRKASIEKKLSSQQRADYALAMYLCGKTEEARAEAALALEAYERAMKRSTGECLLYVVKRIPLLAILGREAEARAACEESAKLPQCATCSYSACKDLDVFRCAMELIFGNYEKATELAAEGLQKWPDEADFLELKYLIIAKGKR